MCLSEADLAAVRGCGLVADPCRFAAGAGLLFTIAGVVSADPFLLGFGLKLAVVGFACA